MADFTSQTGLRSRFFGNLQGRTNFNDTNLFTGVWNLDRNHLDRLDPFTQGYAMIVWTKMPAFFEKNGTTGGTIKLQFKALTEKNFKSFSGISDLTLDAETMSHGFAGNELPVATNLKKENTSFTLRHYELSGSPIRELYQYWITGIRDPETGLATYHGAIAGGMIYSMANHTAELLYVVTDPSFAVGGASGIEYAAYYTNCFPTKIPQDHLNYTSGDHGIPEIDIEFRGNFHMGAKINGLAVKAMKKYKITRTYSEYGELPVPSSAPGMVANVNDSSYDNTLAN